jgi:hypothetical protein
MNDKTFTVTEDHMKLLPHLWFNYNDYTEFGAPEVDPKRPYGNSDVYGDIAEHLEIVGVEDSWGDVEYTEDQRYDMLNVHKDMTTVLNIMVRNNGVRPGRYRASAYGQNWVFDE